MPGRRNKRAAACVREDTEGATVICCDHIEVAIPVHVGKSQVPGVVGKVARGASEHSGAGIEVDEQVITLPRRRHRIEITVAIQVAQLQRGRSRRGGLSVVLRRTERTAPSLMRTFSPKGG